MRHFISLGLFLSILVSCSKTSKDAIDNFNKNKTQLLELKRYFSTVSPKDYSIQLRLKSNKKISLFVRQKDTWKKDTWKNKDKFNEYGLIDIKDKSISDSDIQKTFLILGWTNSTIDSLILYMKKLDTDFICSEQKQSDNTLTDKSFISIGYPTNELYALDYYFLDTCLTNDELIKCNSDCSYSSIDNCVLIKYTGTSWMSDCMPEKRK